MGLFLIVKETIITLWPPWVWLTVACLRSHHYQKLRNQPYFPKMPKSRIWKIRPKGFSYKSHSSTQLSWFLPKLAPKANPILDQSLNGHRSGLDALRVPWARRGLQKSVWHKSVDGDRLLKHLIILIPTQDSPKSKSHSWPVSQCTSIGSGRFQVAMSTQRTSKIC